MVPRLDRAVTAKRAHLTVELGEDAPVFEQVDIAEDVWGLRASLTMSLKLYKTPGRLSGTASPQQPGHGLNLGIRAACTCGNGSP
jgi:hypothetical protein